LGSPGKKSSFRAPGATDSFRGRHAPTGATCMSYESHGRLLQSTTSAAWASRMGTCPAGAVSSHGSTRLPQVVVFPGPRHPRPVANTTLAHGLGSPAVMTRRPTKEASAF
jgi:hypothetical protein